MLFCFWFILDPFWIASSMRRWHGENLHFFSISIRYAKARANLHNFQCFQWAHTFHANRMGTSHANALPSQLLYAHNLYQTQYRIKCSTWRICPVYVYRLCCDYVHVSWIAHTNYRGPEFCYFQDIHSLVGECCCSLSTLVSHFHVMAMLEKFTRKYNDRIVCFASYNSL